jgi:integrase
MHAQGLTAMPFSELTTKRAKLYVAKVKREHGGATAALQKTLLSNLWVFAGEFPDFDGGDRPNPMKGEIRSPYTVQQEHLPWPQEVQGKFLAGCSQHLYRAFHLLICTGQRVSDVVKMKKAQYNETTRRITLARGQKKDRTKTPITIPVSKRLERVLAVGPANASDYLLTHKWGRPYGAQSLALRIRERLREIGETDYTTHGLRKNAGIYLAENGATVPQIMAALGHKTPKMALYYCRLANQALLADQVTDILDKADAKHEVARVAKRPAGIKMV